MRYMGLLSVRVIAGQLERELTPDISIVPAGPVVLAVTGTGTKNIRLDGKMTRLSSGSTGLISLNLTRSTGFHRVEIDGETFWFGTSDAKLGLEGLEAMLADLNTLGTSWTGQALFTDGSGLRDSHVLYGWLETWADKGLDAVEVILSAPQTLSTSTRVLRRRGGAGVLLAPTLRLLRSNPRRNLVEADAGIIVVEGKSYDPLRTVARKRVSTLETIATRRAINLLTWIDRLALEVLASLPDTNATTRCRLWANRAQTLLRRPLSQALRNLPPVHLSPRQPEELNAYSYRTTYEISHDLQTRFGWSATSTPRSRLSYVDQSDAIYQAYVASRIARELDLQQTSSVLGQQQPAFSGRTFDLYYDAPPPLAVLRSWRSYSAHPDTSRPDLLLHERASGRVAVIDAKYRVGADGHASEDSRKEVSAYMALYGLRSVTIAFPGKHDEARVLEGAELSIVEIPVGPTQRDLSDSVSKVVATLAPPTF